MKLMQTLPILLLVAFGAAGASATEPFERTLDPQYFTFATDSGTFRTSVRWGRIDVRGHGGYEVQVTARVIPDRNRVSTERLEDAIDFRLDERDNVMSLQVDSRIEGFYGVELEVLVPRATRLELEMTDGGEISVAGVEGEIDLANRNGSVELTDLGGAAVVDARNGSITASFARIDPDLPMSFSTLNGSIDVSLPAEAAADLRVRHTYGGVESDFDISSVDGAPLAARTDDLTRGETRVLKGVINGGGPRYDFYTANGTVYLRKSS